VRIPPLKRTVAPGQTTLPSRCHKTRSDRTLRPPAGALGVVEMSSGPSLSRSNPSQRFREAHCWQQCGQLWIQFRIDTHIYLAPYRPHLFENSSLYSVFPAEIRLRDSVSHESHSSVQFQRPHDRDMFLILSVFHHLKGTLVGTVQQQTSVIFSAPNVDRIGTPLNRNGHPFIDQGSH
jgi:hypothetical protein